MQPETVTIAHPDDPSAPIIINKSDFDPAIHKPYEPPITDQAPKPEGNQKPPEGGSEQTLAGAGAKAKK